MLGPPPILNGMQKLARVAPIVIAVLFVLVILSRVAAIARAATG